MEKSILETISNTLLGFIGFTITLSSVNVAVSILVGLATVTYLITKVYFLIKNKGK